MFDPKDYYLEFKPGIKELNPRHVDTIIVHCSAYEPPHDIREIHDWHLKRGWSGCGYHLFLRKDGQVEKGRPLDKRGSHTRGENWHSVGICLEGLKEFTQKQVDAFEDLVNYLTHYFSYRSLQFKPHNFYNKQKTCPNLSVPMLMDGELVVTV